MAQGKAWDKENIIELLKPYFKRGNSVTKACKKAGIAQSTVQTWIDHDEELRLKIGVWQNEILEKARENVRNAIVKGDKEISKWILERMEKDDFSTRSEEVSKTVVSFGEIDPNSLPEDSILLDFLKKKVKKNAP